MKKWLKLWIGVCLIFFLGTIAAGGKAEAQNTAETLKILVPVMNNYGFVSLENGELSGYYIDYLEELTKYTGWDYELVPIDNYEDFDKACEEGNYDLMLGVIYSKEYDDAYFEYPKQTVGAKRYVFAVPKDSGLVEDKEYAFLRGTNVGIAKGTGITELEERFTDFCHMQGIETVSDVSGRYENGVNFKHIDPAKRVEAQESGEIDGILASDAVCLQLDMYAIATFGLDQIYFVAPQGKAAILEDLDRAAEKITTLDPEYNDRLYELYFAQNMEYSISFSKEEKAYLEQEHTWKVSVLNNYAPYSYINDEENEAGMLLEAFRSVSEKTDGQLQFEYVFYDSMEKAEMAVQNGECDIAGLSLYSMLVLSECELRRSTSFYKDKFMIYKESGKAAHRMQKAAVLLPELLEMSKEVLPADTEIFKEEVSATECMRLIQEQEAGYTILLEKVGNYFKSYEGYAELYDYPVVNGDVSICIAYGEQMPDIACNVIDKCLAQIERTDLDSYITEVTMFEHGTHSLKEYVKEHMAAFSVVISCVLLLICALLVAVIVNIQRNARKIHEILYTDKVTGGSSYKRFLEEAEKYAAVDSKPKIVLYMNISGFKYINDVFGFEAGNQVLQEISRFLEKAAGGGIFARMYADRFAVLISYRSLEDVEETLTEAFKAFEDMCRKKYPSFNIWIKAGAYVMQEGDDIEKAVNRANYAMDSIEKTSKNECAFYDEKMHDKVVGQKEIEKDMWEALDNRQFCAYYQPKYNIETKELSGAEALVRWKHPQKGLLPPGIFIPVFENNHFIIHVDFYIFECVCCLLKEIMEEGREPVTISSNFSRLHLSQPDFVDRLVSVSDKYNVPREYLEIEITETVATENFEQFVGTISQLKEKGFNVSIDDFGSGYSSIQLLYKLPIDVLKFDRDFVAGEEKNDMKLELLDSIISVTMKNGIKIICEGVETIEQEEFVRSHKCTYVQGFLYSKPVPEEEFRAML